MSPKERILNAAKTIGRRVKANMECPYCQRTWRTERKQLGTEVRCPYCNAVLRRSGER